MAEATGVSDAMMVKIGKKLGFAGFRELRVGLVDYNRLPTTETAPGGVARGQRLRDHRQGVPHRDPGAGGDARDPGPRRLHPRRRVPAPGPIRDFYGVGGSAQIARDVAHKFLRIGIRANVFDDAHMMLMSASVLGPDDVVVAFSHSGRTAGLLEAVQQARQPRRAP